MFHLEVYFLCLPFSSPGPVQSSCPCFFQDHPSTHTPTNQSTEPHPPVRCVLSASANLASDIAAIQNVVETLSPLYAGAHNLHLAHNHHQLSSFHHIKMCSWSFLYDIVGWACARASLPWMLRWAAAPSSVPDCLRSVAWRLVSRPGSGFLCACLVCRIRSRRCGRWTCRHGSAKFCQRLAPRP